MNSAREINADPHFVRGMAHHGTQSRPAQRELASFNPQFRITASARRECSGIAADDDGSTDRSRFASEGGKPDAQRLLLTAAQSRGDQAVTVGPRQINLALEKAFDHGTTSGGSAGASSQRPIPYCVLAGNLPRRRLKLSSAAHDSPIQRHARGSWRGTPAAVVCFYRSLIVVARAIDPLNACVARADSLNAILTSNAELVGQALFRDVRNGHCRPMRHSRFESVTESLRDTP